MEINIESTKKTYKNLRFWSLKNGIVKVVDDNDFLIWDAIDDLIGANQHLIPMSIAARNCCSGVRVVILFVEKPIFGHQSPNED